MESDEMQHLEHLLPSIKMISDADIRRKVAQAWLQMWHRGNYERIEDCSWFEVLRDHINWPNHEHTEQVARVAIAVAQAVGEAQGIKINMDYVISGALMHDVDKLLAFDGKTHDLTSEGACLPHGFLSAKAALDVGLPLAIAHICSAHTADSPIKPNTVEAVIVHFADFITGNVRMMAEGRSFSYGSLMSSYVAGVRAKGKSDVSE